MLMLMQRGRYDAAERVLERMAVHRHEGYEQTGSRAHRARLHLYRGRIDEAAAEIDRAIAEGVETSWEHNICSIGAEIAAARGRLTEARALAAEWLERDVHPAVTVYNAAVLRPLVQAEVDAALATSGDDRERHVAAAFAAADEIRSIGASLAPGGEATTQLERWTTYLALAEAELSRLDDPACSADAWRAVVALPDTTWYRDYAAHRLAEAEAAIAARR
jgi:ATP/maltotriose-dependent transcriptional regulator MalT